MLSFPLSIRVRALPQAQKKKTSKQTARQYYVHTMEVFLVKGTALSLGAIYTESHASAVMDTSGFFGVTPLILIGTGFWALTHGLQVGRARARAMHSAQKAGEERVAERYGLPNLYAQGTSRHARKFNAIQRSHQQIFETYSQLSIAALMGALSFPLTAASCTLLYAIGRVSSTKSSSSPEGSLLKRHASLLASLNWYGILASTVVGLASCIKIIADKRIISI